MGENVSSECGGDSLAHPHILETDRLTMKGEKQDLDKRLQELNPHLHSSCQGSHGADNVNPQNDAQHPGRSSEQDVTRMYEYHLAKRMSSMQSEGTNSLQSSQCSSIDAGCSTGSSSCVTPMDSPLCAAESVNLLADSQSLKGLGYVTAEEKAYGPPAVLWKAGHPVDPTLLRKIHAATSAEPGFGPAREGSHRMPKIKETTGTTSLWSVVAWRTSCML